jgi:COP9 signalosome complex subunit 4
MTIVERAVLEHNMCAVARIYASIRFSDLAHLLETTESKAQVIAAKMITTKVISASVDQVKGVRRFAEAGGGLGELRADWEAGVRGFCEGLHEAADGARAAMEAGK